MSHSTLFKCVAVFVLTFLFYEANAQGPKYPSEITVSKDGTGNYQTVQEAISSVRDLGEKWVRIKIKDGIYQEKVVIPSWKTRIKLIGESKEHKIITENDNSGKMNPICKDALCLNKMSTYTSYAVLIQANEIAIENLSIINSSGRVGQAVALHVEGDRFVARDCNILGNQDTLYAATENSRPFYQHCFVEGTTDFIFGKSIAGFQYCTVKSLSDSYITAVATYRNLKYGFVFFNCEIISDSSVTKAYSGRPWRPYARTVSINCNLGRHILPVGWAPWKGDLMFPDKEKTTFYGEYKSVGLGAFPRTRLPWTKQLTDKEAKRYTVKNILSGPDGWNPLAN
jgi:pectinesterase